MAAKVTPGHAWQVAEKIIQIHTGKNRLKLQNGIIIGQKQGGVTKLLPWPRKWANAATASKRFEVRSSLLHYSIWFVFKWNFSCIWHFIKPTRYCNIAILKLIWSVIQKAPPIPTAVLTSPCRGRWARPRSACPPRSWRAPSCPPRSWTPPPCSTSSPPTARTRGRWTFSQPTSWGINTDHGFKHQSLLGFIVASITWILPAFDVIFSPSAWNDWSINI